MSRRQADMALPSRLSGSDKDTFAFLTIRDRMPVILTRAIDTVHRHGGKLLKDGDEAGSSECSSIVGRLSKLKNEMQTNKPMTYIVDDGPDLTEWNGLVDHVKAATGVDPAWFTTSWLFAECYMYRRIREAIALSEKLNQFDPFEGQKKQSFHASEKAMNALSKEYGSFIKKAEESANGSEFASLSSDFERMLKHSLWGNKTDLSLLATRPSENLSSLQVSSYDSLLALDSKILADDTQPTFRLLLQSSKKRVDIVLDNSGFELFNDLCLADWLLSSGLTHSVHLHLKCIPWFVSDVMREDFDWLIDQLSLSEVASLRSLGQRWRSRVETNKWVLQEHKFWTLPHEFLHMKTLAPDLYDDLSQSDLIFFKGDLNYRKLLADRRWLHHTSFAESLCEFKPAPLCALRSLKAELISGLAPGQADLLTQEAKDWLISGRYAVIQLHA